MNNSERRKQRSICSSLRSQLSRSRRLICRVEFITWESNLNLQPRLLKARWDTQSMRTSLIISRTHRNEVALLSRTKIDLWSDKRSLRRWSNNVKLSSLRLASWNPKRHASPWPTSISPSTTWDLSTNLDRHLEASTIVRLSSEDKSSPTEVSGLVSTQDRASWQQKIRFSILNKASIESLRSGRKPSWVMTREWRTLSLSWVGSSKNSSCWLKEERSQRIIQSTPFGPRSVRSRRSTPMCIVGTEAY